MHSSKLPNIYKGSSRTREIMRQCRRAIGGGGGGHADRGGSLGRSLAKSADETSFEAGSAALVAAGYKGAERPWIGVVSMLLLSSGALAALGSEVLVLLLLSAGPLGGVGGIAAGSSLIVAGGGDAAFGGDRSESCGFLGDRSESSGFLTEASAEADLPRFVSPPMPNTPPFFFPPVTSISSKFTAVLPAEVMKMNVLLTFSGGVTSTLLYFSRYSRASSDS